MNSSIYFYRLSLNIFHRHLVYFGITLTNYVKLIHLIKKERLHHMISHSFIYILFALISKEKPCTFVSNAYHKRNRSRQLNLGYPTAHMRIHLMLLPSGPDMIHGFILHRTEIFKHYVLRADFTKMRPQQRN